MWQREGKTARVARAVGKEVERRVEGGAKLQGGAQGRAGAAACSRGETEWRADWGRRRGPGCKKQKVQGSHCKAWITFTLMLKWRWIQKQKCVVFQNAQLCFKVRPQKSNSFENNMKLI
jgi:hypothetical protein